MKRIIIMIILCLFGMTVFAQNMSYYTSEYMRPDGSFADRLIVLETVRDAGLTGIGEFYHEALRFLLLRAPDIRDRTERDAAEKSAIILCQGLGAERHTAAAGDLWHTAELFDVVRDANDGNAMQAALIALGQVTGRDFIPQIVQRLNNYNSQTYRNAETRRRVQMAVIGCISALEAFRDISGYRPVFFASNNGGYDPSVRQIASNALPNIADDPGEIISAIIQDSSVTPNIKLVAWNEMLRTRAPDASKANVAAVALTTGWTYATTNRSFQANLSEMRKGAINTMRQVGIANSSVYEFLERSYSRNFLSNTPDFDEIMLTLNTLAAVKSDQAVEMLVRFLRELHGRRRSGPWGEKERQVFQWVVACIGFTETRSEDARQLLTTIQRTNDYTPHEQRLAANALSSLGG